MRALFATALEEGLICSNPTAGVRVAARDRVDDENNDRVKALSEAEVVAVLGTVQTEWRLFLGE